MVRQLDQGEDYTLIQPVYSLNLVNDKCFDLGDDEFYHDYAIVNVAHTDRIISCASCSWNCPSSNPRLSLRRRWRCCGYAS